MTREPQSKFGWKSAAVAYCVLAAFTVALLWPLVYGRALYWGDLGLYFEPMADYLRRSLAGGKIPLWNPYVLGGQPYIGNPQMAVFYPNTLLLYLMPAWAALSLSLGIHLFLCGAFMYVFLRRWTESGVSALCGGMVYMGSACLMARLQFPPMVVSAAYLPLILRLIDRQIERPELRTIVQLGAAFGLLLLAAHTQMAYFETLLAAAYLTARLARRGAAENKLNRFADGAARRRWTRQQAAPFFASALLGIGLSAAQIVPAAQLVGESLRVALTAQQANRFFLEARQLLTLINPHFVGHPATGDYHAAGNAWEPALFVGWIPLLLMPLALRRWNRWRVRLPAILAVLGIWMAFGILGGLYQIGFVLIPGLSKFHDPARFLYFTTFAFAALTALGCDSLRETRWFRTRVAGAILLLTIALPLVYYGQEWNPTTEPRNLSHTAAIMQRIGEKEEPPPNPLLRKEGEQENSPVTKEGEQQSSLPAKEEEQQSSLPAKEEEQQSSPPYEGGVRGGSAWAGAGPNDSPSLRRRELGGGSFGRIYQPVVKQAWQQYISYYDFGRNDARTVAGFLDTAIPNTNMNWQVESFSGYEPVPVAAAAEMDLLTLIGLERGEAYSSRVMALMNANTLLLPSGYRLAVPGFVPLAGGRAFGGVKAYHNRNALPRVWLTRRVRRIEGRERILAALIAPDFDPATEAIYSTGLNDELAETTCGLNWNFGTAPPAPLLHKEGGEMPFPPRMTQGEIQFPLTAKGEEIRLPSSAKREEIRLPPFAKGRVGEGFTDLTVDADAGEQPAYLVASLVAYPGWRVTVDGQTETPLRTDGAIMGMPLRPGRHRVSFRYAPAAYRFGLYLSLIACAVLSAGTGYLMAARRREIRP